MKAPHDQPTTSGPESVLSNAEIADLLASLAQLLSAQKENPYKVKAYRRAAAKIRTVSESIDELARSDADLTAYAGIGEGISGTIREIVQTGTLAKLEQLRAAASPELSDISQYPRLDPERILRIYKKLSITSVDALRRSSQAEISKRRSVAGSPNTFVSA
jgi:DNA polymerase (family X)